MCREIRKGKPLLCEVCLPPLWPVNQDALRVYLACRRQVLLGPMGQIIDIRHDSVHRAMALYQVDDPIDCFEKVLALADELLLKEDEE